MFLFVLLRMCSSSWIHSCLLNISMGLGSSLAFLPLSLCPRSDESLGHQSCWAVSSLSHILLSHSVLCRPLWLGFGSQCLGQLWAHGGCAAHGSKLVDVCSRPVMEVTDLGNTSHRWEANRSSCICQPHPSPTSGSSSFCGAFQILLLKYIY